ncbi:MAG: sulfatase-like hydrolase/transferase, partial [Acidihalobacter sp.]
MTPSAFQNGEPILNGDLIPVERDVQHLKALYDGEISYWDEYLGKMLAFLQENQLMENTLLVITSDHGEQFGEHGKWVHANSLYEEVLRVPLYMRYDGIIPAGIVLDNPVQNFDLMPTILEWAGIGSSQNLDAVGLQS